MLLFCVLDAIFTEVSAAEALGMASIPQSRPAQEIQSPWAQAERFYLGLPGTGHVCRPTCPTVSRAEHKLQQYATLEETRSEGLQPCCRCTPHRVTRQQHALARAKAILDDHARRLIWYRSPSPLGWTDLTFSESSRLLLALVPSSTRWKYAHPARKPPCSPLPALRRRCTRRATIHRARCSMTAPPIDWG